MNQTLTDAQRGEIADTIRTWGFPVAASLFPTAMAAYLLEATATLGLAALNYTDPEGTARAAELYAAVVEPSGAVIVETASGVAQATQQAAAGVASAAGDALGLRYVGVGLGVAAALAGVLYVVRR